MPPIIQDKLLDLIVNFIAIVLAGGLITVFIEWQRHQREKKNWKMEDELIQIDIPRSEMIVRKWQIEENTTDENKLMIYENKLQDTVKQLTVISEFVIRNTTAKEIIITKYDVELLQIPSGGYDFKRFYDLETFDHISVDEIGAVRLKPYTTIPRFIIYVCNFGKNRVLDTIPTTLVISAKTSSGKIIQSTTTSLRIIPKLPDDLEIYENAVQPKRYVDKIRPPSGEDDIPF
jgi:hypothetical protein